MKRRTLSLLLVVIMLLGMLPSAVLTADAAEGEMSRLNWREVMDAAKAYLTEQAETKTPVVSSTKGEWLVLGLARAGVNVDSDYFAEYYENVEKYVGEKIDASTGRLHASKSTDNARVILALTALGKDVTNVGGYNLLKGLSNTDYVRKQGINGPVWALIALDSGNYEIPADADSTKQVTREWLVEYILSKQLTNGGWALSGQTPDDMTPMAIQALAPYYESNAEVKAAVDKAITAMAGMVDDSFDAGNSETLAQIIVALSAMGMDADTNSNFSKDGVSVVDALLRYSLESGAFQHGMGSGANQMSTEQSFYALVAYDRFKSGKTSLYDMSDALVEKFSVTVGEVENGTVTVDKTVAVEGETVTVTVSANTGYKLESLRMNGTELTVTDGKASFAMPAADAIITAEFKKVNELVDVLRQAMEELIVEDASKAAYDKIREIETAYAALTDTEKEEIWTAYEVFLSKVADFDAYLEEAVQVAVKELKKHYNGFDRDDYSDDSWSEIEAICADAEKTLMSAAYQDQADEILSAAIRDMDDVPTEETITVWFCLIGDFMHDGGVADHVHYVTWIPTVRYELPVGSTMYDLFVLALEDAGLSEIGASNNYVESIQAPSILGGYWLGEFDNGVNSGWMYTVNGDHPGVGLCYHELQDGDDVIWHYVDDYKLEERNSSSKYYYRWLEAEDIAPAAYMEKRIGEILQVGEHGNVVPGELSVNDLGRDITFTFTPDEGYEVREVIVDGLSLGSVGSYTYENLSLSSRISVTFAEKAEEENEEKPKVSFKDVAEKNWFCEDVQFVVENGLFEGTGKDEFSPYATMTRAMLVTVLYRLEGEPAVSGKITYGDVQTGKWYTDAVIWASQNGIVSGYDNGLFGTNDNVTREQMAAILYRYASYKGYSVASTNSLSQYTDAGEIHSYALSAIKWANAVGLINGRTNSTLVPGGTATRAEVAAIFHRFVENLVP